MGISFTGHMNAIYFILEVRTSNIIIIIIITVYRKWNNNRLEMIGIPIVMIILLLSDWHIRGEEGYSIPDNRTASHLKHVTTGA